MKTLTELTAHMKKYNDTLIIIGNGVNKQPFNSFSSDDFNENYTRKNFKRNPEIIWDFYNKFFKVDVDNNDIYKLINQIKTSMIINQNVNGSISAEYIHGHINKFICPKCKTLYTIDYIKSKEPFENKCEQCGSIIRPSILFSGERYDQALYDKIKETILNTHTIMLIGMDYSETPLMDLIQQYGDMKTQINAIGEEQKVLVAIQDKDEIYDPNETAFCEFLVQDDIEQALIRFLEIYNKEN